MYPSRCETDSAKVLEDECECDRVTSLFVQGAHMAFSSTDTRAYM